MISLTDAQTPGNPIIRLSEIVAAFESGTTGIRCVLTRAGTVTRVIETLAAIDILVEASRTPLIPLTMNVGGATVYVARQQILSMVVIAGVTTLTMVGGGTIAVTQTPSAVLVAAGVA